jgi:acetyltransferase-like isoleucine patch superfamily enzyme
MFSKLIKSIKGSNYKVDKDLSKIDKFYILLQRLIMLIRGFYFKIKLNSKGFLFIDKNVVIKHGYKAYFGKNITIKDNCNLNFLVKEKVKIGNNFTLGRNSTIEGYGILSNLGVGLNIGNNVGIGAYSFIAIRGKIEIGDNTIIGPFLRIHPESHLFNKKEELIRLQGTSRNGIKIGSNCWIGSNVTILDGVQIGNGVVIGANSLVTKCIADNEVHFGVPAKFYKTR